MELDPAFDADLKTLTTQPKVEVTVPVRQMKSDNKRMDNVMYAQMNQTNFPTIKYRLLALTPKAAGSAGAGSQFEAKGELTVSGVTKTNTMAVTLQRIDKTKIKVTGATDLKMTAFGISPPVLIGLLKTGDDVKLSVEWLTAQPAADAK
jgi:polyisoprenoid-binding protein YceI